MDVLDSKSRRLDLLIAGVAHAITQTPDTLRPPSQPSEPSGEPSVDALLAYAEQNRTRLKATWRFYFLTTIANYVVLLATLLSSLLAIAAANDAVLFSAISGFVVSLLVALIWKPQARLLIAQSDYLRLDTLATALSILLEALKDIKDPSERARQTAQAVSQISDIAAIRVGRRGTP